MKWCPSTTFSLILVFALLAVFALWLSFRVANTAMLAMADQRELDKVQTVGRMVSGTLDGQESPGQPGGAINCRPRRTGRGAARTTWTTRRFGPWWRMPGVSDSICWRS